ncbi:MAG: hypothetical protein IKS46_06330, partial [Clostridia bacterium]|nr:hypothetical protein [Clostridia bacterium]
ISDEKQERIRAKYTDGNPYFMFVGSLHPRKNLARLFTAFDRTRRTGGSPGKGVTTIKVAGEIPFFLFPCLRAVFLFG